MGKYGPWYWIRSWLLCRDRSAAAGRYACLSSCQVDVFIKKRIIIYQGDAFHKHLHVIASRWFIEVNLRLIFNDVFDLRLLFMDVSSKPENLCHHVCLSACLPVCFRVWYSLNMCSGVRCFTSESRQIITIIDVFLIYAI